MVTSTRASSQRMWLSVSHPDGGTDLPELVLSASGPGGSAWRRVRRMFDWPTPGGEVLRTRDGRRRGPAHRPVGVPRERLVHRYRDVAVITFQPESNVTAS